MSSSFVRILLLALFSLLLAEQRTFNPFPPRASIVFSRRDGMNERERDQVARAGSNGKKGGRNFA